MAFTVDKEMLKLHELDVDIAAIELNQLMHRCEKILLDEEIVDCFIQESPGAHKKSFRGLFLTRNLLLIIPDFKAAFENRYADFECFVIDGNITGWKMETEHFYLESGRFATDDARLTLKIRIPEQAEPLRLSASGRLCNYLFDFFKKGIAPNLKKQIHT